MRESVLEQMGLSADTDPNQVLAMLPDEALQAIKEGIIEEMGNMGDTMLSSMGVAFVKDDTQQMGMDMEGTQMGLSGRRRPSDAGTGASGHAFYDRSGIPVFAYGGAYQQRFAKPNIP